MRKEPEKEQEKNVIWGGFWIFFGITPQKIFWTFRHLDSILGLKKSMDELLEEQIPYQWSFLKEEGKKLIYCLQLDENLLVNILN